MKWNENEHGSWLTGGYLTQWSCDWCLSIRQPSTDWINIFGNAFVCLVLVLLALFKDGHCFSQTRSITAFSGSNGCGNFSPIVYLWEHGCFSHHRPTWIDVGMTGVEISTHTRGLMRRLVDMYKAEQPQNWSAYIFIHRPTTRMKKIHWLTAHL